MAFYFYSAKECFQTKGWLLVKEGMRMSEIRDRPELQAMSQGIVLELRLPDGTTHRTHLANYGVGMIEQADGSFLAEADPYLYFYLPLTLTPQDIPPGTELWWLQDEPKMSAEEVQRMLNQFNADMQSG